MKNSKTKTFSTDNSNAMLSDVFFKDFEESRRIHSLIQNIEEKALKEAWKKFNDNLRDKMIERLEELNCKFSFFEEFEEFLKSRITNIQFSENTNLNYLYLDYEDENNKGIFLFSFSTEVQTNFKDGLLTITIG